MLGWLLNSLSRRASIWVNEWNNTSLDRNKLNYSSLQRILLHASESPFSFVLSIWFFICAISIGTWIGQEYFDLCLVTYLWKESELLTYFGTLWTLQGTVCALVYPIVIAFVAVLLQRRSTVKLSLRLYYIDAAVIPSGASAIALLTWMGIEHLSISYLPTELLSVVMVGNSIWFVLNSMLTGWFLYRTVQYLNDDERLQVFNRFAVQIAFPREVKNHLLGLIFSNAQSQGFIPGKDYTSDDDCPKVSLYPVSEGLPCIRAYCKREQAVIDIRLRLLSWGVFLWLRQANKIKYPQSNSRHSQVFPLLEIPIIPGETYNGDVILCRVVGNIMPGTVASFLIRHSIIFSAPPSPNISFSSYEIMEELAVEALVLAEQKRFNTAKEVIRGLVNLHANLIRAGAFVNDNNLPDNAALIPDPYGFSSLRIHENWLRVYRQLAEIAVKELQSDSSLFKQHCYLAYKLVNLLQDQDINILLYLQNLSSHLMYRMGNWWSNKIEEHGQITHNAIYGVILPLSLDRLYDSAIKEFIGGWEALCLREKDKNLDTADATWAHYSRHALFAATHAEHTVKMILGAVLRGDKTAAVWLTDSFQKWWNNQRHKFDSNQFGSNENPLLTFECVHKNWQEVRENLEAVPNGQQEHILAQNVVSTVLRKYWSDLRLVLILVLLDWTPAEAPSNSLTLELISALLHNRDLKHGGNIDADVSRNASKVLNRLLHVQLTDRDYENRLDKIVEYAQELRTPSMVSGRIYSSSGANDIHSLCVAQCQFLIAIASAEIPLSSYLKKAVTKWANDLQQLERCSRLAKQLKECTESESFITKTAITSTIRKDIGLSEDLKDPHDWVIASLSDFIILVSETHEVTLASAQLSQVRINEVAEMVSKYVLTGDKDTFPFSLKPSFLESSEITEPHYFTISGIGKGAYTEPPLETVGSHLDSTFNEYVYKSVASSVIADRIKIDKLKPIRSDSEVSFFEDMQRRADTFHKKGLTPLLLVSEHCHLEWLNTWRYLSGRAEQTSDVSFRQPREGDSQGLIGYFNDIPAYRVPLSVDRCFVIPAEEFEVLKYTLDSNGSPISVTVTQDENHKISLKFEWSFHSSPRSKK